MRFRLGLTLIMVVLLSAVWLGCTKDSGITGYQEQPGLVLSVLPADGSTSVATSTSITLAFSSSMDRDAFQQDFLFLPGQRMQEFMDSLNYMHSGMDSMYMQQMYHQYCIQGEFHWNIQNDSCVFQPDSALGPMSEHMLYLMQHRDQQMHMHQHQGATMQQDFRSHFTTADN
jgi:hypothetical protein